jgi:hypothetical protein
MYRSIIIIQLILLFSGGINKLGIINVLGMCQKFVQNLVIKALIFVSAPQKRVEEMNGGEINE